MNMDGHWGHGEYQFLPLAEVSDKPEETRAQMRDRIKREVCEKYNLSWGQIASKRRRKYFMPARYEAGYRLHVEAGITMDRIGQIMGNRDHSTIVYYRDQHAKRLLQSDSG
jgi:chromosomal replication initiation ATPase DnaA